jgi:hypothetical protein
MRAGAGAFIGTLWAVRSGSARRFAEKFYGLLTGPQPLPLGDAAHQASMSIAQESGDPTWLAYIAYGNPFRHDPGPELREPSRRYMQGTAIATALAGVNFGYAAVVQERFLAKFPNRLLGRLDRLVAPATGGRLAEGLECRLGDAAGQ